MKLLSLWGFCALQCARAAIKPHCAVTDERVCAERNYADIRGDWNVNQYIVEGVQMSVATSSDAVRWSCAGLDPTTLSTSAPRFTTTYYASDIELEDCNIPLKASYMDLFEYLNVDGDRVKSLSIRSTNHSWNSIWLPTDHLEEFKQIYEIDNEFWLTAAASDLPKNSLQSLTLHGLRMTTEQLISIHNIQSLTLIDTGLQEVMNLSEFYNLNRLEIREINLLNAEHLASAPDLKELVLHAPDAGLTSMPSLTNATFIEVYMIGSLFGNCKNLRHLALEGGELTAVPGHWLAGCKALESLKLTQLKNLITLPDDLLDDTSELRRLVLSYNGLTSLPEGLFDNARRLEYLDLRHNHLKSLPVSANEQLVTTSIILWP